jgi:preprotein translocase SecE subunit
MEYRAREEDRKARTPGFFTIYKKGQGYWTRMGTAICAAALGAAVSWQVYENIWPRLPGDPRHARNIALAISVAIFLVYAFFAWKYINKPASVDFLIATDSEMKKVNWTSRKELIGSTKIVILFMFAIAISLFLIDIVFGYFFYLIGVLKSSPFSNGNV